MGQNIKLLHHKLTLSDQKSLNTVQEHFSYTHPKKNMTYILLLLSLLAPIKSYVEVDWEN